MERETSYHIEVRDSFGYWSRETVEDAFVDEVNTFATRQEAEGMIEEIRKLGSSWYAAEYRVLEDT